MHQSLRIALSATVLASLFACSGGGGGGSAVGNTSAAISGKVIDGPISGATVCLDVNGNNACDTGEPTATTDAQGNYKLPNYAGNIDGLHILAVVPAGAIDLDTNTAVTTGYMLMAPASNPSAVTPLTTLVSTQMLANPTLTAVEAERATLVSNNLIGQTESILGVDVTTNANLHKVAQTVVGSIAQTAVALGNNSTFTAAAGSVNYSTAASLAATQGTRLTQSMLLQQMQNSDGGISNAYYSNGAVNTAAVNTLVTNAVNDVINYIAATTRAGKSSTVTMQEALDNGITAFSIAGGGYYLDANNTTVGTNQSHYLVERFSSTASKNGKFRDIGGNWRKSSFNFYDLVNGTWVAEYSNAAGSFSSNANAPTISGSCFTAPQTPPPNSINLKGCATKVELAGKKLSDFNFDCKDPSGTSISGCNVNDVFPANAWGYNLQVTYDTDQYQLMVPINGTPYASSMTSFISTYMQSSGPYVYYGGNNSGSDIAMNIASYDSSAKTGVLNWYDNTSGSFTTPDETSTFKIDSKDGVDVFTANYPNLFYRLGGGSDQTTIFAYAPAGTNTGSQAGVFRGWKYSKNLATNMYFGMPEQNMMNSVAFNFIASKYQLPTLP